MITSLEVAKRTGVQHHSLMTLISRYKSSFLSIEPNAIEYKKEMTGGRPLQYVVLSESALFFLVTLMKNTKKVIEFKRCFVRELFENKKELRSYLHESNN